MAGRDQTTEKARLIAKLEAARREMAFELGSIGSVGTSLGSSLNPRRRIADSIRERPLAWAAGGLVAGALLALVAVPRRSGGQSGVSRLRAAVRLPFVTAVGRSFLFKTGLKLLRPSLETLARDKLSSFLSARLGRSSYDDYPDGPREDPFV